MARNHGLDTALAWSKGLEAVQRESFHTFPCKKGSFQLCSSPELTGVLTAAHLPACLLWLV